MNLHSVLQFCVVVLCCFQLIAPDPPSCADSHISYAHSRSGSGTLMTQLWQCSTDWHPSLPGMPFAVSA